METSSYLQKTLFDTTENENIFNDNDGRKYLINEKHIQKRLFSTKSDLWFKKVFIHKILRRKYLRSIKTFNINQIFYMMWKTRREKWSWIWRLKIYFWLLIWMKHDLKNHTKIYINFIPVDFDFMISFISNHVSVSIIT